MTYFDDTFESVRQRLSKQTLRLQSSQRNTLHPCAHELHMGCTTGELALSDEMHPSLKP